VPRNETAPLASAVISYSPGAATVDRLVTPLWWFAAVLDHRLCCGHDCARAVHRPAWC
jgi:hypothetical protein